jgi:hypothetical protein
MVGENGDTAQLLGREEKIYKSASSGSYHSHTAPHQLSLSLSIANALATVYNIQLIATSAFSIQVTFTITNLITCKKLKIQHIT